MGETASGEIKMIASQQVRRSTRRRAALAVMAGALIATTAGSVSSATTVPDDDVAAPTEFAESPLLAERVEAGDLPPVEERLPAQPYVVRQGSLLNDDVLDVQIGQYGGTLELAQESPEVDPVILVATNEPLLWTANGTNYEEGVEGNLLADWSANEDNTVFTFTLREGIKWSDGVPVTMDDVRFAFEDVIFNEELTQSIPAQLRSGGSGSGTPLAFDVVDEWTFSLTFDQPYGGFIPYVVSYNWNSYEPFIKPKHYLEQFHADYADPAALEQLIEDESVPDGSWVTLFNSKTLNNGLIAGQTHGVTSESGIGHPTLTPWVLTSVEGSVFTYERNPYYFKVDAEGNQLPYIDRIRSQVVQDYETLTSRALFGEFDYLGERAAFTTFPLMREREEEGLIKILTPLQHAAPLTVYFNQNFADENWQALIQDARFLQALNLAVNRQEVIDEFYFGQFAELPTVAGPGEFNPDEANRLLDEMGLSERDGDGCRVGPDGSRVEFLFELFGWTEGHVPVSELISAYWRDVGICVTPRVIADLNERMADNSLQANLMFNAVPMWPYTLSYDYLPLFGWAPLWLEWWQTDGASGEEPQPEMAELFTLHEELLAAGPATEAGTAALEAITTNYHENQWIVQVVENNRYPTFVTTRIQNFPTGFDVNVWGIIVSYSMEQWFIDEEQ